MATCRKNSTADHESHEGNGVMTTEVMTKSKLDVEERGTRWPEYRQIIFPELTEATSH